MAIATFAAGCFWGVELTFAELSGVTETAVGYMGGSSEHPDYQAVCQGDTGHAEVVQVVFDTEQLSYEALLAVFWQCHNPTTLNRQGPDVGTQYRSVIFYQDEAQRVLAEQSKADMDAAGVFAQPVVTQILPVATFWRAEEYHQQYLAKRGQGHCRL
ncbi:peptide-methionine (S)-S-oxide reductase MsrA [Nitrincola iocasae]|jgi:peptide-methionine (S)-S-oxide reductase|uniref:Peptide methionine sulfoxide reductase MsrA n=1 Tax=Nitrincola iocasae TaxID=2614693 RepID=A0A5J6LB60_9GAMM|nr:peptide-methionine (S)-S-oxide reductase MsrA [Nitrincola iocasae]QEW05797.1 peptide-methionine (S)-S-oxide reductase MsrA [Nitrincola iocasae]